MKKLKSKREWLEGREQSNSYYDLVVSTDKYDLGHTHITLADCSRSITWYFGKPGEKRGVEKIKKLKALVDSIYLHLVPEDQR